MIGTPLFLNNFNYTHTIENVNKIICTFSKTFKRINMNKKKQIGKSALFEGSINKLIRGYNRK